MLQHYYWFKRESAVWASSDQLNALTGGLDSEPVFPISMEYLFRDTILALRPNLTLCSNLEEATAAIEKLQTTLISQLPTLNVSISFIFLPFLFAVCTYIMNLMFPART